MIYNKLTSGGQEWGSLPSFFFVCYNIMQLGPQPLFQAQAIMKMKNHRKAFVNF